MLIKTNTAINEENIMDFMTMKEEDFASKLGITVEQLEKERSRFKITD